MKKLEQHLQEPVVVSCLVMPRGAAAGSFAECRKARSLVEQLAPGA